MFPANEGRCYILMPSLIGWAHVLNDTCIIHGFYCTDIINKMSYTYIYFDKHHYQYEYYHFSNSMLNVQVYDLELEL